MTAPNPRPPGSLTAALRLVGPGIVVAATGVGAGDLVAAAKAGATFGLPVLWAAGLGAVLKFVLAEGVARWQLATGKTVLQGWTERFGRPVQIWFLAYLVLWTLIVAAALMSACGLATHALFPQVSVAAGGVLHGLAALLFVWLEGYGPFERAMKFAIALMFLSILGSAAVQAPPLEATLRGLVIPSVPAGSPILLLGMVGGVGGTLTLLSYNYWIREKGWEGPAWARGVRVDLATGYVLTGVFGVALTLLAAAVLHPAGVRVTGADGVLEMAVMLGSRFGRAGELVFLIGFWGAVATSIVGVWQGVPYLFADYVHAMQRRPGPPARTGRLYRGYLLFLTFPPMLLLTLGKPVWVVVAYAAVGSLFMPFLATTLLILNNRKELGALRNGWPANLGLAVCVLLFAYLAAHQLMDNFASG